MSQIPHWIPTPTHEITNQAPPLGDLNLFTSDFALMEAVAREAHIEAHEDLARLGAELGTEEHFHQGRLAHRHPPVLHLFDQSGRRRDEVEFHPAWHHFMRTSIREGVHTGPWADPQPGAHVIRAAKMMMLSQVEPGHQCPITMTYGVVPALRHQPDLAEEWLPRLFSRAYDPAFKPAAQKVGAIMGMGMTEKQGGSDVRTNATRATPVGAGGPGAEYTLVGHKWFFSAPQCDAWLVLGQAPEGLSCFLVPRWRPDGTLNPLRFQRLKDKLGNRSNASSEVEFHGVSGWLVGEPGRGVPTIIEMATWTRLDCCLGSTACMRQALTRAVHHVRHRQAFGRLLIDQPLMANVVADLAVESEAATALSLRLARAFDRQDDPAESAIRRVLTPAAKFWICKRAPMFTAEAMEVLGGNGYVEEGPLALLYREAPLNSIWEGSGNVMCLDVLRALRRTPEALEVLLEEVEGTRGTDLRLDTAMDQLKDAFTRPKGLEARARQVVEQLVLTMQGALLVRFAPPEVADAFCATRLGHRRIGAFGGLPVGVDHRGIIERAVVR